MFSSLKRLFTPPSIRRTISAIYGMIVAQARNPVFYQALGVPDTVEGRFDNLVLQMWLVLHRLRSLPDGRELSQALFDHFCSDMDANLREMGVGDLTVPKRMQKFGEAFYGRSAAYDAAIAEAGEGALRAALARNVLNRADPDSAAALAGYVASAAASLAARSDGEIAAGAFRFPALAGEGGTAS